MGYTVVRDEVRARDTADLVAAVEDGALEDVVRYTLEQYGGCRDAAYAAAVVHRALLPVLEQLCKAASQQQLHLSAVEQLAGDAEELASEARRLTRETSRLYEVITGRTTK